MCQSPPLLSSSKLHVSSKVYKVRNSWRLSLANEHQEGRSVSGSRLVRGPRAVGSQADGQRKRSISMQPTAPRMADEQPATVACHACLHVLRSGRLRSSGSIEAVRSTVPETFLGCVVSHPSYGARGRALGSAVVFLVLRGSFLFWNEKGALKGKSV